MSSRLPSGRVTHLLPFRTTMTAGPGLGSPDPGLLHRRMGCHLAVPAGLHPERAHDRPPGARRKHRAAQGPGHYMRYRPSAGAVPGRTAQDEDLPDACSGSDIAGCRAVRSDRQVRSPRNSAHGPRRPPALAVGGRAGDADSPQEGSGPPRGLPLSRPAALPGESPVSLPARTSRPSRRVCAMPAPRPRSTLTAKSGPAATSPPAPPSMPSSPLGRNSDGTASRPPRNGPGRGRCSGQTS
jgi:hypothetical protein